MKNLRRKKLIIVIAVFLVVVLLGAALLIYFDQKEQKSRQYAGDTVSGGSYAEEIEYQGKKYRINNQMMTIALIGVDSTGPLVSKSRYGEGGQADSITLILMDREKETIQILPISRDTMTQVHTFSAQGYDNGTLLTHLGFAYTFGDGGTVSCKNTCLAVSDLLKGIGVHYYAATNLDSLAYINRVMGGITVTVPNNDIAHLHPECTQGAVVTLNDGNVSDFLRYRAGVSFSNQGRMERSRAFYEGFVKKVQSMSASELNEVWNQIQGEGSNILTSFSRKQYLELMDRLHHYTYDAKTGQLALMGHDEIVEGYDAFYPDEDALMKLVVNTFYKEK